MQGQDPSQAPKVRPEEALPGSQEAQAVPPPAQRAAEEPQRTQRMAEAEEQLTVGRSALLHIPLSDL